MTNIIDQSHWFNDYHGEPFRVTRLSPSIAKKHQAWLLKTHNEIPLQHWTARELFASGDGSRSYLGKWEISRIALSISDQPLAFCIGFEMIPDNLYYNEVGIYLHRLAVDSNARGRRIGALLQTETIAQAFARGLCFVGNPRAPVLIFGQTNKTSSNEGVRLFHRAAGFQEIGEKPYPDRTDVVMRMDAINFWSSRHVWQWRSSRIRPPAPATRSQTLQEMKPSLRDIAHFDLVEGDVLQSLTSLDLVKKVVSQMTGIPPTDIFDGDRLEDILAPDSLLMTEFWMAVEQHLDLDIGQERIQKLGTVADIAVYLTQTIRSKRDR